MPHAQTVFDAIVYITLGFGLGYVVGFRRGIAHGVKGYFRWLIDPHHTHRLAQVQECQELRRMRDLRKAESLMGKS